MDKIVINVEGERESEIERVTVSFNYWFVKWINNKWGEKREAREDENESGRNHFYWLKFRINVDL